MNKKYFFFENRDYDIPFYRNNPKLTQKNLIILLAGLIIAAATPFIIPIGQYHIPKAIIITLATLIPVAYTLKGNLETIFRAPTTRDILPIIFGVIFYMALSILASSTLAALGVPTITDKSLSPELSISLLIMIIQLLGEELLKFIAFVIAMTYAYKHTSRKNSIIIGIIVSQLLFALFHIPAYGLNIIHLLVSIGLVSSILPIIYLRTKNITVTYITHLLIDVVPVLLSALIPAALLLL